MKDCNVRNREDFIKAITIPDKPELNRYLFIVGIISIVVGILCKSPGHITWFLRLTIGGGVVIFGTMASYFIDYRIYKYAINNFEEYKKQMIKNYDGQHNNDKLK